MRKCAEFRLGRASNSQRRVASSLDSPLSTPDSELSSVNCQLLTGFIRVATVARLLGVSRRRVQYMLEEGRLHGMRIRPRGWWRVSRASVARLLSRGR